MKGNNKDNITLKDLWKHPFYNSLIKLGMWILFFLLLYLILFISNMNKEPVKPKEEEPKVEEKVAFTKMESNLITKKQSIIYNINDYYITGIIDNNTLTGTLEDNSDSIIKIKYNNEKLYQVKKEEEQENNTLLENIKLEYLLPSNIIKIIDNPKAIGIKSADGLTYSYNIDDLAISVYLNDKYIEKIIILDSDITYNLEYKEVVNES